MKPAFLSMLLLLVFSHSGYAQVIELWEMELSSVNADVVCNLSDDLKDGGLGIQLPKDTDSSAKTWILSQSIVDKDLDPQTGFSKRGLPLTVSDFRIGNCSDCFELHVLGKEQMMMARFENSQLHFVMRSVLNDDVLTENQTGIKSGKMKCRSIRKYNN